MKVSLAGAIRASLDNPKTFPQIYDEFIELALLAEESGFHRVWLSEHHLAEDGWNPGCMLSLAALARLTTRVRLGSFVLLLPLYHPLKVAEEVAMLDILSKGRFDLAIGARAAEPECAAFGIVPKEAFGRSYEALHVIQRFLTEESVTHHGKHFHFDDVAMTTKPVQKPHPPIFTTPLYGPQSAEKSAERGYSIASALHSPYYKDYGAMLARHGRGARTCRSPRARCSSRCPTRARRPSTKRSVRCIRRSISTCGAACRVRSHRSANFASPRMRSPSACPSSPARRGGSGRAVEVSQRFDR